MVFVRPPNIPFPTTWHRFTVQRGEETISLRVQDLTDEFYEPAIGLLNTYYNRDEPASKCVNVQSHPIALAELDKFWRGVANQKLSLVCVVDKPGSQEVVAFNCIDVLCKDDPFEHWESEDRASQLLFGSYELVARSCDVFAHFGVSRYLNGNGIVVHPQWRRMNVAVELLKARIPLCKALGLKVTATVFTGAASQAVAVKAGYSTLSQISYAEMVERGFHFTGMGENSTSKLMVYVIK